MKIASIKQIQIAPDKGVPMQLIESATVTTNGILGDRYEGGIGAWSHTKHTIERHISLIEQEVLESIQSRGFDITFADTRRNILTSGIDLNSFMGRQFALGSVLVEGVELCDPCGRLGMLAKKAELREQYEGIFDNKGGLRVKVVQTGRFSVNDRVYTNINI